MVVNYQTYRPSCPETHGGKEPRHVRERLVAKQCPEHSPRPTLAGAGARAGGRERRTCGDPQPGAPPTVIALGRVVFVRRARAHPETTSGSCGSAPEQEPKGRRRAGRPSSREEDAPPFGKGLGRAGDRRTRPRLRSDTTEAGARGTDPWRAAPRRRIEAEPPCVERTRVGGPRQERRRGRGRAPQEGRRRRPRGAEGHKGRRTAEGGTLPRRRPAQGEG